jgi:serine/threonine-protein kinase RIO1
MQGKSIKNFVLEQIFPAEKTNKEQEAWNELQALLASRISDAENGAVSNKTFDQITDEVIRELS